MAYVVGMLTEDEKIELERRGWELEAPPPSLLEGLEPDQRARMWLVFVDTSMFDVMDGPDWEKGHV